MYNTDLYQNVFTHSLSPPGCTNGCPSYMVSENTSAYELRIESALERLYGIQQFTQPPRQKKLFVPVRSQSCSQERVDGDQSEGRGTVDDDKIITASHRFENALQYRFCGWGSWSSWSSTNEVNMRRNQVQVGDLRLENHIFHRRIVDQRLYTVQVKNSILGSAIRDQHLPCRVLNESTARLDAVVNCRCCLFQTPFGFVMPIVLPIIL